MGELQIGRSSSKLIVTQPDDYLVELRKLQERANNQLSKTRCSKFQKRKRHLYSVQLALIRCGYTGDDHRYQSSHQTQKILHSMQYCDPKQFTILSPFFSFGNF